MEILSGKRIPSLKAVVYGPEGIGKTTFVSRFPEPLFIDTEDSTKFMDVRRFAKPTSWAMLLEQARYVRDTRGVCQTLVVDTADWAERLCIRFICDKYQKSGIESFDYGKGYTYVYEAFGELLNLLTEITEKGVHVAVTAHAATKRREQPDEFGTYDCWGLKLIDSPKCSIANMVKEWADLLLFANYKTYLVATDSAGKKHKAQGGKRVMYTTHHPCWDAKNRQGLPDEMPLDYDVLRPYLFPDMGNPLSEPTPPRQEPRPTAIRRPGMAAPPVPSPTPPAPPDVKPETAHPAPPSMPTAIAPADPPPITRPDTEVPAVLLPLMENVGVTENEIREIIAAKGYYTMDTPWSVMEQSGFVNGWVLPFWDKIVDMITSDPNRIPF